MSPTLAGAVITLTNGSDPVPVSGPRPSRLAALPSCLLEHLFLEPSCHTVRKPRWPHGEAQVERTPLAIYVSEEDTLAGSMQSQGELSPPSTASRPHCRL